MTIRSAQTTPATGAACMFDFKEFAKANGWTVPRSSDGITYNPSGDQITTGAAGAGGMANNYAWFELRCPAGLRSLVFQRITTNLLWRVKYEGPGSGFTGGTPTATRVPTATREVVVRGGGTDAAPTGYTLHTTDGTYRAIFTCDDEPSSDRLGAGYFLSMATALTASDAFRTNITIEPLDDRSFVEADSLSAPTVGDADPVILVVGLGTGNSLAWSLVDTSTAWGSAVLTNSPVFGWYKFAYAGAAFVNLGAARPATNFSNGYTLSTRSGISPYDGKDELMSILMGRSDDHTATQRGIKGELRYTRQKGVAREFPDTIDLGAGQNRYLYTGRGAANTNHLAIPWEVGVTPVGTVASVEYDGRDLYADPPVAPVDGVPPVVSVISTTPILRYDPWIVEVTDDVGLALVTIGVELRGLGRPPEVAFDGDAFSSQYSGGSTKEAIAGGFRFTLYRADGWIASPSFRVLAVDAGGNLAA